MSTIPPSRVWPAVVLLLTFSSAAWGQPAAPGAVRRQIPASPAVRAQGPTSVAVRGQDPAPPMVRDHAVPAQTPPVPLPAAPYIGKPIVDVQVISEGQRIIDLTVLGLVETHVGEPLSMASVRESISHL